MACRVLWGHTVVLAVYYGGTFNRVCVWHTHIQPSVCHTPIQLAVCYGGTLSSVCVADACLVTLVMVCIQSEESVWEGVLRAAGSVCVVYT